LPISTPHFADESRASIDLVLSHEKGPSSRRPQDQRVAQDLIAACHTALNIWAVRRQNMVMKVRRIYHHGAFSIEPWATLRDAAKLMRLGGFSCLPVVSGGELFGIITERDLVEALSGDERPETSTVFSHMTEKPATVALDDECADAVAMMLSLGCRHLPVVQDGRIVGIVSARDLLPLAAGATAA
jgi:signal-transduction protein with cAMP-binding, CBS, and nucleotidyltransferase domain